MLCKTHFCTRTVWSSIQFIFFHVRFTFFIFSFAFNTVNFCMSWIFVLHCPVVCMSQSLAGILWAWCCVVTASRSVLSKISKRRQSRVYTYVMYLRNERTMFRRTAFYSWPHNIWMFCIWHSVWSDETIQILFFVVCYIDKLGFNIDK